MPEAPKSFRGKVALITGASTGIGRALALSLAAEGADLVLVGRGAATLSDLGQEAALLSEGQVLVRPIDVGEQDQVREVAETAAKSFGRLDILINNAGVGYAGKIVDSDPGEVWEMIRTNLWGVYLVTRYCLPLMLGRGSGDIVNISSMAGLRCSPGYAMYSATKFALKAFSEALREEVQGEGLRVLTVYPGMNDKAFASPRPQAAQSPLPHQKREMMKPEQVSKGIVLALSHPPEVAVNELVIRPSWQEG